MKRVLLRTITVFCMLYIVATVVSLPVAAQGLKLLVLDYLNNRVLRYDGVTGAFIDVFVPNGSGGLAEPQNLTIGPDGNLYIGNWVDGSVKRYDGDTGAYL